MLKFLKIKFNKQKGFTLIELMVAIAIIAVLSSLVLTNYKISQMKARDAQRINDMQQIQTALEMFRNKNGTYPNRSWVNDCDGSTSLESALSVLVYQGYIPKIPKDPNNPSPSPQCIFYKSNNNCGTGDSVHPYVLIFQAENKLSGYSSWNNEPNRYCVYPS